MQYRGVTLALALMNANRALCPEKTGYLHSCRQVQGQCTGSCVASSIVAETSK